MSQLNATLSQLNATLSQLNATLLAYFEAKLWSAYPYLYRGRGEARVGGAGAGRPAHPR